MSNLRKIQQVWKSEPTIEGAGVHLRRAFGSRQLPKLDPFLLLDDFHSDTPADYLSGFPWHPHRGMETITYVLDGTVEHGDSMGNEGVISSGDVQWMTAGSGIIHQEMPKGDGAGRMWGFQLWANLPSSVKMMPPRYQEVRSGQIPEIKLAGGARVRIMAGTVGEIQGPVRDIVTDPEFLDVSVPAHSAFAHPVKQGHTVFAYVVDGQGYFEQDPAAPGDFKSKKPLGPETLILYGDGDEVMVVAGDKPVRFVLASGKPLRETIAWQGPIVMNTREEVALAFEQLRNGSFINK